MKALDIFFGYRFMNGIKNIVEALKMIRSFYNIINMSNAVHSVRFKNITSLVVSKTAAFDMIRVVCKIHLHFMVEAARNLSFLFVQKCV